MAIDLNNVRVYDPKTIDMHATGFYELQTEYPKAAAVLRETLQEKVANSRINGVTTLQEYLYRDGGFFAATPEAHYVLFCNGQYMGKNSNGEKAPTDKFIRDLEEHYDSLAFVFGRPIEV